jgi:hypothetical protein
MIGEVQPEKEEDSGMPPLVGDKLLTSGARRAFQDALREVSRVLDNGIFKTRGEITNDIGRIFESEFVRSEQLQEALTRAQSEAALDRQILTTVRDGVRGMRNDHIDRVASWDNNIRHQDSGRRENFLWQTWDWMGENLKWIQNKLG